MPQPFVRKPDLPDITDERFTQAFQVTQEVAKEVLDTSATLRAAQESRRQLQIADTSARRTAERRQPGDNAFGALASLGGQIASGVSLMRELDIQQQQLDIQTAEQESKFDRKVAEKLYSAANLQVQDLLLQSQGLVRQYGLEQGNYITQQRINGLLDTPEWRGVASNHPDLAVKLRGIYQGELKSLEREQTEQHVSQVEDARNTQVGFLRHNFRGLVSDLIGSAPFVDSPSQAITQFNKNANHFFAEHGINDAKTKLEIIEPAMNAFIGKLQNNYATNAEGQQLAFKWTTLTNDVAEFQTLVDAGAVTADGRPLTQIDLENFKNTRAQELGIPGASSQVIADRAAVLKYQVTQQEQENRLENYISENLEQDRGLAAEVADTAKLFSIGSSLHRALNNDPLELERISRITRHPNKTAEYMLSVPQLFKDLRSDVSGYKELRNDYLRIEQNLLVVKQRAAPSPNRVIVSGGDELGGRTPTFEQVQPGTADRPSPTATPEQIQNLEKQLQAKKFDMDSLVEKWQQYGINVADPRDRSLLEKMGLESAPVFERSTESPATPKVRDDSVGINRNQVPDGVSLEGAYTGSSPTSVTTPQGIGGDNVLVGSYDNEDKARARQATIPGAVVVPVNVNGKTRYTVQLPLAPPGRPLNPTAAVRRVEQREPNRPTNLDVTKPGAPLVKPLRRSSTSGLLPVHDTGQELRTTDNVTVLSGNTGRSTGAHVDIRIKDANGRRINPSDHVKFVTAGGKPLSSYPMTSGYGRRVAPIAGASTDHTGIDYGVPSGTKLEVDGQFLGYLPPEKTGGGGWTAQYRLNDGTLLQLLHLSPPQDSSSIGNGVLETRSGKQQTGATVRGGTVMTTFQNQDGTFGAKIVTPSGSIETIDGLRSVIVQSGQLVSPGAGIGVANNVRFSVTMNGQKINPREYLQQSTILLRSETARGLGAKPDQGTSITRIGAEKLSPGVYRMPSGRVYNTNNLSISGGRNERRYAPEGRTYSARNPVKNQKASINATSYSPNKPDSNYGYKLLAQDQEAAAALAEVSTKLGIPGQFLADIIAHESGWNTTRDNGVGYYGLIQFGDAALSDLGLTRSSLPRDRAGQLRRAVLPYLQNALKAARTINSRAGYNTIEDVLAAIWGGPGFLAQENRSRNYSDGWITWDKYLGRLGRDVGRSYSHTFTR